MPVRIEEHPAGEGTRDFIAAGHSVFRDDPAWVPPLEMDISDRLNPRKNPFFEHADAAVFTAWRDGKPVGRVTAQIDHEHLRRYGDETGFFGFFDTIEDGEVARDLLGAAEAWLRQRAMKRMRGPLSLSINEEVGVLVEGFEAPPVILMAHSRPYQAGLIEASGFTKAKDFLAWKYVVGAIPPRAERAWQQMKALDEVRFRSVRKSDLPKELPGIMEVFNDAWSSNWGFVPATEAEVRKTAEDLKLILDEDVAFVVEIDGRIMGICIALPNVNEAIRDLDGKLFPFGLAKLLWRMKVSGARSVRLMLLGIRKELRHVKRYGPLSTAMYAELLKRGAAHRYEWAELSWTLEDNAPVNLGIKAMGGKVYKKYRVYEKAIAQ